METETDAPSVKINVLVEIATDSYDSLLKRASEASPVYFRLKNAVKTEQDKILIPCSFDEAEMLLQVAKHFCPAAVNSIETAIKRSQAS